MNWAIVRNFSWGGGLKFVVISRAGGGEGAQHPLGPENPLKSIDFLKVVIIFHIFTGPTVYKPYDMFEHVSSLFDLVLQTYFK